MARVLTKNKVGNLVKYFTAELTNASDDKRLNDVIMSKIEIILNEALENGLKSEIEKQKLIEEGRLDDKKGIYRPKSKSAETKPFHIRQKGESQLADSIKNPTGPVS